MFKELFDDLLRIEVDLRILQSKAYNNIYMDFLNKTPEDCFNARVLYCSVEYIIDKLYPCMDALHVLNRINDDDFNKIVLPYSAYKCLQVAIQISELMKLKLNEKQYIWDKLLPFLVKKEASGYPIAKNSFENFVKDIDTRGAEWSQEDMEDEVGSTFRIFMPEKKIDPINDFKLHENQIECCCCKGSPAQPSIEDMSDKLFEMFEKIAKDSGFEIRVISEFKKRN